MTASRGPVRVLVVEDEPIMAAAHAQYVTGVRGLVLAGTAGTVRDAVRALRSAPRDAPVDLVLLDLDLPDGHGLDLVRSLRAAKWTGDVIAVTSTRDLVAVRAAVSLGVVQYLLKPFTRRSFEEKLARYLDFRAQLHGEGGADEAPLDQGDVDRAFAALRSSTGAALPSGLAQETLDSVRRAVAAAGPAAGASASEVATACGTSRVTARRYLEHLTEAGELERHQRYGGTGRPEVEYRSAQRHR
ncbi:response regulator [Quadrisphaera setariae]|nr:response regulator [Quadrisphaera setariae]